MAIWYPEDVRKRIHEITTKYPNGFMQEGQHGRGIDLAELDLRRYNAMTSGQSKLKRAILGGRIKQSLVGFTFSFPAALMMLVRGESELDETTTTSSTCEIDDSKVFESTSPETNDVMNLVRQDAERRQPGKSRPEWRGRRHSSFGQMTRASITQLMKPVRASLMGSRINRRSTQ